MARITVEDCLVKIPNRFQLVLAATYRARMLSQGHAPKIDTKNKPGVTALRDDRRRRNRHRDAAQGCRSDDTLSVPRPEWARPAQAARPSCFREREPQRFRSSFPPRDPGSAGPSADGPLGGSERTRELGGTIS